MQLNEKIKKLVEVFKVATDDTIGNVARQIYNLNWQEGLSARNQAHKHLDELALTNQIKKGKGFYSVKNEYQGDFKPGSHDRLIAQLIAQLLCLKLPVKIHREVSFSHIGLRADLVILIKKNEKYLCVVIEACNKETENYRQMKTNLWKSWEGANRALSELFQVNIPHFSVVISQNQPDDGFSKLIGELKCSN
jgi:hypothetical protein